MRTGFTPDPALIRTHFQHAASTCDAADVVMREVGERMFSRLEYMKLQPQCIVDLGSGTGYFSQKLAKYYRQAQLIELDFAPAMLQQSQARVSQWQRWLPGKINPQAVCADMTAIPLATQSVDMIWANATLLWQDTPDQVLAECHRILKPNGLFMFSTFGPDTLKELRIAFSQVDQYAHVHRFIDMHDVGDALIRQGFSAPVMDMEYMMVTYDHVHTLLHDLKATGANNALLGRPRGLMGKKAWQEMLTRYERLRVEGELPATYEVIYGHAWKNEAALRKTEQPVVFYPTKGR